MTAHRDGCRCTWCRFSREMFAERIRAELHQAAETVEPTRDLADLRERIADATDTDSPVPDSDLPA